MKLSIYFFSADDEVPADERYQFLFTVAQYADRAGYHAVWTPERHFQEFGGCYPNPAVLTAALSRVTQHIGLRAGSVVLPHHHPARIAEDWALIDQLSGGRAGVCLATGWHKGDFVFHPEHYQDRREYTFDQVATLRALWRGEAVSFPGPDGEQLEIRTFPRPVSKELPLWAVHSTNPQTWVAAGTQGLNVLTLLDNWERLEHNIGAYRAARADAGLDPLGGTVTVGIHTFVGVDDDVVRAQVRGPLSGYLSSFLTQRGGDAALRGESKPLTPAERETLVGHAFEDLYQHRSLLGTPDKCIATVERLAGIGVDEVACLVDFGMPLDLVVASLPQLDTVLAAVGGPSAARELRAPSARSQPLGYYATRRS